MRRIKPLHPSVLSFVGKDSERTSAERNNGVASTHKCAFCLNTGASYTCPRCNSRYCSLQCYKSTGHSVCTESFFKDSVMEQLRADEVTDEERKETLKLLHRFEKLQSDGEMDENVQGDDDDDYPSLAERLADIDLDSISPDDLLSRLTQKEREEFEVLEKKLSGNGAFASRLTLSQSNTVDLIENLEDVIWSPWWTNPPNDQPLIEVLGRVAKGEASTPQVPDVEQDIVQFEQVTRVQPADNVVFAVIDLLFSYVLTCRHLNGEIGPYSSGIPSGQEQIEQINEACECVSEASLVLGDPPSAFAYEDPHHVVIALRDKMLQHRFRDSAKAESFCALLDDVVLIVQSPHYTLSALSHLRRWFKHATAFSRTERPRATETTVTELRPAPQSTKRRWFAKERKMYFYLCLVHDCIEEGRRNPTSEEGVAAATAERLVDRLRGIEPHLSDERRGRSVLGWLKVGVEASVLKLRGDAAALAEGIKQKPVVFPSSILSIDQVGMDGGSGLLSESRAEIKEEDVGLREVFSRQLSSGRPKLFSDRNGEKQPLIVEL